MFGMGFKGPKQLSTGCKDCGSTFQHYPPDSLNTSPHRVFSNVYVIVYTCPQMGALDKPHFMVEIRCAPAKVFLACGYTLEALTSESEINKILEWAKESPED